MLRTTSRSPTIAGAPAAPLPQPLRSLCLGACPFAASLRPAALVLLCEVRAVPRRSGKLREWYSALGFVDATGFMGMETSMVAHTG